MRRKISSAPVSSRAQRGIPSYAGSLAVFAAQDDTRANMPTLRQKIRLAIRGWNRRREEANAKFVASNVWEPASAGSGATDRLKPVLTQVDMEGLVCAFLDDSGRIAYYFDNET